MKITAKPRDGHPGYRAVFRDPRTSKVVTVGLSTQDGAEAQRICNDIATIFGKPALLSDKRNPALLAYHFRAVSFIHGEAAATELFRRKKKPVLDDDDIQTLGGRICVAFDQLKPEDRVPAIDKLLREFESLRYKELQDRFEDAENRLKTVEPRMLELEAENARLRKAQNLDIKVTIGEAVDVWKVEYKKAHADVTYRQAANVLDGFIQTLPDGRQSNLGEIQSQHVNAWLEGLARKDGNDGELSPTSRRNRRAYLSTFFNKWARRKYHLFESPLNNALGVDGVERQPKKVVAIRRREDLDFMFDALKPFPYWRAWFVMATLCGPRWAEMQWMRLADVFLDDGYFRVATRDFNGRDIGTKTGDERDVPIERTVAIEIIREHVEARLSAQRHRSATPAGKSEWLFPSLLPEHPFVKRRKSLVGQWSDNSSWRECWDDVAVKIAADCGAIKLTKDDLQTKGDSYDVGREKRARRNEKLTALDGTVYAYLGYGPAEWRHTFGTTAFLCGFNGLEISRMMGNSPAIAEKNYISNVRPGKRWTFKWS